MIQCHSFVFIYACLLDNSHDIIITKGADRMNISEKLFNLFMTLPPDYARIEQLIKAENYSCECISETFCKFAEECFCECSDFMDEHGRKPLDEEIHSTYVFLLCELLLKYGLDPNYVFGEKNSESNAMYEIYWIDKPYVAADTLKLLLEHGGNPYTEIDGESLWHLSDFDIYFDVAHGYAQERDYKQKFDNRVHFWLVLRGFLSQEEAMYKEHHLFTYKLDAYGSSNWNLKIVPK